VRCTAVAVSVVRMSSNRTVSAVELASQLRWDAKKLRGWLRAATAGGHPLLRAHSHNDSWVFTSEEADQLRGEMRRGPWKGKPDSSSVVSKARPSPVPMREFQPESNTMSSATNVAGALMKGPAVPAGTLRIVGVPTGPGLYAWWGKPGLLPGVTHRVSGPTLTANGTLELAYIGIAGSLRRRLLGSHLGSSTGSSTLRRALGAWLGAREGWATEWRSSRVQHGATSELALTKWMHQNLQVTWVEHASPNDVESDVIAVLAPPLNSNFNQGHPNWPALDAARREWRRRGTPDPNAERWATHET
jgi:hypothetical protein